MSYKQCKSDTLKLKCSSRYCFCRHQLLLGLNSATWARLNTISGQELASMSPRYGYTYQDPRICCWTLVLYESKIVLVKWNIETIRLFNSSYNYVLEGLGRTTKHIQDLWRPTHWSLRASKPPCLWFSTCLPPSASAGFAKRKQLVHGVIS